MGVSMRAGRWLARLAIGVGLALSACGGKEQAPTPGTTRPEAGARPRELAYTDKVEAVRRLLKQGEVEAGLKAARELVDDHRIDAEGWVVVATAHQIAGDSKEALKAAKVAAELDPKSAEAWVAVGAAERMTGGFAAAEAALQRALELDPGSRAARFNLAGIAADKGQYELARKELTTLVEADPDDFETRFLLATTFLAQKELGPAREQLARIVERFPQHFKAQRALAALAWAEGNYKRAFERATIASRLRADDPETTRLLEGSFYVVAAARLVCEAGPRPWPADKIVSVLERLEREEGLEGAGSFLSLDERYGGDALVNERIARAAAGCMPKAAPEADAGSAPSGVVDAGVGEPAPIDAGPGGE